MKPLVGIVVGHQRHTPGQIPYKMSFPTFIKRHFPLCFLQKHSTVFVWANVVGSTKLTERLTVKCLYPLSDRQSYAFQQSNIIVVLGKVSLLHSSTGTIKNFVSAYIYPKYPLPIYYLFHIIQYFLFPNLLLLISTI